MKNKKAEMDVIRSMAPRIERMFFGPGQQFAGLVGTLELTRMAAQLSNDADVQFANDFIARVENFTAELRHDLYGAALTATELPRVLTSLPSPENSLQTILNQIDIQEEALDRTNEAFTKRLNDVDALLTDESPVPSRRIDREDALRRLRERLN